MAKLQDAQAPYLTLTEQAAAPANPAAGDQRLYTKTGGKMYRRNSAGTEVEVGGSLASVWLNVGALEIYGGSPSRALFSGAVAWLFDASAEEIVGSSIVLPTDWATFDVEVWWAPTTTGAGAVRWDCGHAFLSAGAVVSNAYSGTPTNSTAPGVTGQVTLKTLLTAVANQSGKPYNFRVLRNATDVGDTYAADAALLGLKFIKAS